LEDEINELEIKAQEFLKSADVNAKTFTEKDIAVEAYNTVVKALESSMPVDYCYNLRKPIYSCAN